MTHISKIVSWATAIILALLSPQFALAQDDDQRSYRLGAVAAWSEAVSVGVKELALSAPTTPDEMDALIREGEAAA